MGNSKSNWTKGRVAIIVIWTLLVINIFSLIFSVFQLELVLKLIKGIEISDLTIEKYDYFDSLISSVTFGLYVISIVTFLNWFAPAYLNLLDRIPSLSATNTQLILSWFIPIINLYRPFDIMKEMFRRSQELLIEKKFISNKIFNISLLSWWWNLWIFDNIVILIKRSFLLPERSAEEFIIGISLRIFENILYIALVIVTAKMIRGYENIEYMILEIPIDKDLPEQAV
ncbi:DUF4328 domain-containing protein [Leptospira sarikeiensis]|uniref:DUF4328 domain-containing protein n=1 Tax=Leptospira sarikeiensis TaxID=2484943 RepID=A0A4R9JZC2_9LEPT|nr:DUF4328 domain-containing protein [Leptospira sarikeiensis]TGL58713.1 DUF4328 domain-containing protein [Leptospira sarikeiensis]